MKNKNSPADFAGLFLFCSFQEPADEVGKHFDLLIVDAFTKLIELQKV